MAASYSAMTRTDSVPPMPEEVDDVVVLEAREDVEDAAGRGDHGLRWQAAEHLGGVQGVGGGALTGREVRAPHELAVGLGRGVGQVGRDLGGEQADDDPRRGVESSPWMVVSHRTSVADSPRSKKRWPSREISVKAWSCSPARRRCSMDSSARPWSWSHRAARPCRVRAAEGSSALSW